MTINPHIKYSSDSAVGPDGIDWYNSSSSDGFKLSAQGGVALAPSESYRVGMPNLSVSDPSDDVVFFIHHFGVDSTGYKLLHAADVTANADTSTTIGVHSFSNTLLDHDSLGALGQSYVNLSVLSSSNIDWKKIDWRPYLYNSTDTIYPVVHYGMYNNLRKYSNPKNITSSVYQNATTLKSKTKDIVHLWGLPRGV